MRYKELPKNPLEITIQIIDSKWKILIITGLLTGTKRFNELKKILKGVSQKVLAAKLRELENIGILTRHEFKEPILKVEYSLTDVGYSLSPVIKSMTDWGKDYKKYIKLLDKMK